MTFEPPGEYSPRRIQLMTRGEGEFCDDVSGAAIN
jgi:hypothetical protein